MRTFQIFVSHFRTADSLPLPLPGGKGVAWFRIVEHPGDLLAALYAAEPMEGEHLLNTTELP